jgi:hypothetical protein
MTVVFFRLQGSLLVMENTFPAHWPPGTVGEEAGGGRGKGDPQVFVTNGRATMLFFELIAEPCADDVRGGMVTRSALGVFTLLEMRWEPGQDVRAGRHASFPLGGGVRAGHAVGVSRGFTARS